MWGQKEILNIPRNLGQDWPLSNHSVYHLSLPLCLLTNTLLCFLFYSQSSFFVTGLFFLHTFIAFFILNSFCLSSSLPHYPTTDTPILLWWRTLVCWLSSTVYVIFIVRRNHYIPDNIGCVQKEKKEKKKKRKKLAMKHGGGVVLDERTRKQEGKQDEGRGNNVVGGKSDKEEEVMY